MSAETEMLHVYLTNVWRLLFDCSRGSQGWGPIGNESFYNRIWEMGVDIGRNLDEDLESAQTVVDAGGKFHDWMEGQRGVAAPS